MSVDNTAIQRGCYVLVNRTLQLNNFVQLCDFATFTAT